MGIPTVSNVMLMGAAPDLGKLMSVHLSGEGQEQTHVYAPIAINYVCKYFADAFLSRNRDRAKKYRLRANGPVRRGDG